MSLSTVGFIRVGVGLRLDRAGALRNFLDVIRSPVTREKYVKRLERFLGEFGFTGSLEESASPPRGQRLGALGLQVSRCLGGGGVAAAFLKAFPKTGPTVPKSMLGELMFMYQ